MDPEIERLAREVRAAKLAIRRAGRSVSRMNGRELGRYQLAPGEALNPGEVIDFLRLALGSNPEGVVIVVSQAARPQTEE